MARRRRPRGLACPELVELVTAYLEQALPAPQRRRFEAHLETCPDCNAYVAEFAQTVIALGALGEEEAPPEPAFDRLMAAFRRVTGGR
jgi:anti-sigma factor RsiW